MVPKVLLFLVPAALLLASVVAIVFWERSESSRQKPGPESESEGAFRAFYHVLWILMLWSGVCLSLPLWVSYRDKLANLALPERWQLMIRVLVFPAILLLLLLYGGRRGYLKWIDSLRWPDEENR